MQMHHHPMNDAWNSLHQNLHFCERFSVPVHTKCMQRRSNAVLPLCYPCSSWLVICQFHFHFWPFLSICHRSIFTFLNFDCFYNWWSILDCSLACSLIISLPVLDNQQSESLDKQKNFVNCELKTHCIKELPNNHLLWHGCAAGSLCQSGPVVPCLSSSGTADQWWTLVPTGS